MVDFIRGDYRIHSNWEEECMDEEDVYFHRFVMLFTYKYSASFVSYKVMPLYTLKSKPYPRLRYDVKGAYVEVYDLLLAI